MASNFTSEVLSGAKPRYESECIPSSPGRAKEVPYELDQFHRELERLGDVITHLHDRLHPVLSPSPEADNAICKKTEERPRSDLAVVIYEGSQRVSVFRHRLESIVDLLEL
jgi:hypothetical protein